MKQIVMSETA